VGLEPKNLVLTNLYSNQLLNLDQGGIDVKNCLYFTLCLVMPHVITIRFISWECRVVYLLI